MSKCVLSPEDGMECEAVIAMQWAGLEEGTDWIHDGDASEHCPLVMTADAMVRFLTRGLYLGCKIDPGRVQTAIEQIGQCRELIDLNWECELAAQKATP
jgi:hypothetical protein